jgi:hypothetical protein
LEWWSRRRQGQAHSGPCLSRLLHHCLKKFFDKGKSFYKGSMSLGDEQQSLTASAHRLRCCKIRCQKQWSIRSFFYPKLIHLFRLLFIVQTNTTMISIH